MSDATFTAARALLQPFLIFLHQAEMAKEKGQPEAQSIWLQAVTHLHDISNDSVGALTLMLIQQQQYANAITLADVIARLRPDDDAAANFQSGYVLEMANRHGDASAGDG
ncbi:hypothetical protein [Burkholderia ubonensis]|uniref:hypothetical protein n=1 Tax=Burkholderia ubonensis TaxID=101571 RepID=UPI0007598467|nr:hypothetical protein [Burkholderia ubonensis]KVW66251.1 hypothetical protein WK99_11190 [Burkholderia ubonensis]KWN69938.1 hypothetical protein WM24_06480 [Burkholderia ubonensis]